MKKVNKLYKIRREGSLLVTLNKGAVMKKYLFSLGTMLVGLGLMFLLMHGEVSADDFNKVKCEILETDTSSNAVKFFDYYKI